MQQKQQQQQQVKKPVTVTPAAPVNVNNQERNQAFQKYAEIRTSSMTLATKQVAINNHLDYMVKKGFITPLQKQHMSNLQPSKPKN